jgi:hypothetical protein
LADYLFFDVESQDRATSTYDYCLNDEKASALGAPRLLPMAIARFGTSQTNLSSIHRRIEAGGYRCTHYLCGIRAYLIAVFRSEFQAPLAEVLEKELARYLGGTEPILAAHGVEEPWSTDLS